jgi:hypothetical protein
VDELARARWAGDLEIAAALPDPRAERRRRLAEPDLEFRALPPSCTTPDEGTLTFRKQAGNHMNKIFFLVPVASASVLLLPACGSSSPSPTSVTSR